MLEAFSLYERSEPAICCISMYKRSEPAICCISTRYMCSMLHWQSPPNTFGHQLFLPQQKRFEWVLEQSLQQDMRFPCLTIEPKGGPRQPPKSFQCSSKMSQAMPEIDTARAKVTPNCSHAAPTSSPKITIRWA